MGTDTFWYRSIFLVHIFSAMVGLGGVMLNGIYGAQAMQRGGDEGQAILAANWRVTLVAEKVIYVVPLAGLVLVWLSDGAWSLGRTWVWLSLVAFVAAMAVSNGIVMPAQRSMLRELRQAKEAGRAPDEARIDALARRMGMFGPMLHLLTVFILVLMIWKPGS